MSEFDFFDEQDEGEPPPLGGGVSAGRYLGSVIEQIGSGLQYADYVNPESNCSVTVNVYDLEIAGEIKQYEIARLLRRPIHESVNILEQRLSNSMWDVAAKHGAALSLDSGYDFPTFVGTSGSGAISFMFREPRVRAILIGDRLGSYDDRLRIRSEHIQTTAELRILLGGLATFLTAVEVKKHIAT